MEERIEEGRKKGMKQGRELKEGRKKESVEEDRKDNILARFCSSFFLPKAYVALRPYVFTALRP